MTLNFLDFSDTFLHFINFLLNDLIYYIMLYMNYDSD